MISGAKAWTSGAHLAGYILTLCRTAVDPKAPKDERFTQFLVPLPSPGVTIRPTPWLDGSHDFNEVHFDDVVVTDEAVLGEIGRGWRQVIGELAWERSGPERFLSTMPLLDAVSRDQGIRTSTDGFAMRPLGRLVARLMAARALSTNVVAQLDLGSAPDTEAALVKYLGTNLEQDSVDVVRDLVIGHGVTGDLERLLARAVLRSPAFTLRGGTTEVLESIITARHRS